MSANKACIKSEKMKGANINMAWRHDGKQIAIGNKEDVLTIYDVTAERPYKQLGFEAGTT